jgi:hypothetical protein
MKSKNSDRLVENMCGISDNRTRRVGLRGKGLARSPSRYGLIVLQRW